MVNIIKDKEEVKSVMNIIQAFADGKTIQAIDPYDDEWCDQTKLNFEALFEGEYRIKPEPKYRPFKDAEECWREMLKHQPFGWITSQNGETNSLIIAIDNEGLIIGDRNNGVIGFATATDLFKIKFADGVPFGVKVEE